MIHLADLSRTSLVPLPTVPVARIAAVALRDYPRVSACLPCRRRATDVVADAGSVPTWEVSAVVLAFHDSGHLLDVTQVATQHFGI